MSKKLFSLIFIFIFTFIIAGKAEASNFQNLNYGAENTSLGGAGTFTTANYFSATTNPATLSSIDKVMLGAASALYLPSINSINYERESTRSDRGIAGGLDTSKENMKSALLGFTVPIISDLLTLGFVGLLPIDSLVRIYTVTTRESHLLLYNSKDQRPEIYTALGVKLPYGFSLGAGLYYSLKVDGTVQASVLPTDALARMYIDLKPVLTPYVGLLYKNNKYDFDIGTFYRDQQSANANVNIDINFELNNNLSLASVPFAASSNLITFFEPAVIGLGGSYKYNENYKFYFGALEKMWSRYHPPIILLSGKDLDILTGGVYESNKISLKDTYSFHLGFEFNKEISLISRECLFSSRLGVQRHTSALPSTLSSLNILDTEKTIISLGAGVSRLALGILKNSKMQFNLAGNLTLLDKKDLMARRNDFTIEKARIGGHILAITGDIGFEY
ncbi:MAG: hypothetical protein HQK51_07185 [Oligoflexia bacterium]|nr:hypothetical protein [Oligoflexia bacterium]